LTHSFRRRINPGGVAIKAFLLRGNLVDTASGIVIGLAFAAVPSYFVIKPVNALMARRRTEPPVAETTRQCPACLSAIPVAARRCAFCTAVVA
jgi:hypothetical protein